MNEKIYKTMGRVGGGNIAMGAVPVSYTHLTLPTN